MQEDNKTQEEKIHQRKLIDEIQQLMRNIRSACEKNRAYYKKIMKTNPLFNLQLYNPPIHLNTKKDKIESTKQILIKQFDRLLDEEIKLKKEINKIQFKQLEEEFEKENQLNQQTNQYLFLRNVWKRPIYAIDCQDKIQKLNKSVALIKGHILAQTQIEQQSPINNSLLNYQQYDQLKQKYQNLLMEKEDQLRIQQHSKTYTDQQNRMKCLQTQNDILRNQLKEYKQKLINSEKDNFKNMKKVSELESTIAKTTISKKLNTNFITYTNLAYEISIKSDLIANSNSQQLTIPLNQIINFLQGWKEIPALSERSSLIQCRNESPSHLIQQKIKKNNQSNNSSRSKRLKSIGEKPVLQEELKKGRFIRTKKMDQNINGKQMDEHFVGLNLPPKPKYANLA